MVLRTRRGNGISGRAGEMQGTGKLTRASQDTSHTKAVMVTGKKARTVDNGSYGWVLPGADYAVNVEASRALQDGN